MRRHSSLHPALAPALSLVLLGSSAAPPAAPSPATPPTSARTRTLVATRGCAPVRGTVSARVTGIAIGFRGLELRGRGTSSGDLSGAVQLSIRKRSSRADTLRFVARLQFESGSGSVVLRGEGTAIRSATASPLRRVDGRLDVSEGSGGFASAAGGVLASGTADTGARQLVLDYTGSLCGQ